MVPAMLLFSPFEKAFVKQHTRNGKTVGPYFTKRQKKVAIVRHTKKTRLDLTSSGAKKKIESLHAKKKHHEIHIESAQILKKEVEKHKSAGNTHYKIGKQEHHVDKLLSDLKDHIDHHSNEKKSHENHIAKIESRHETEAKYWDEKRESKKVTVKKQQKTNQYSEYSDTELRKKEVWYDRVYNEGGEGYNPYRDESEKRIFHAEKDRPKTIEDRKREINKQLEIKDSSIYRESGMYDQKEIDKLRDELKKIEGGEKEDFKSEWTKDVTIKRRKEWNDFVSSLIDLSGKISHADSRKIYLKADEQGWGKSDLRSAVKMHGL